MTEPVIPPHEVSEEFRASLTEFMANNYEVLRRLAVAENVERLVSPRKRYIVHAETEENFNGLVLFIHEPIAVTQSHGLTDAEEMARDCIATLYDIEPDSFDIDLMLDHVPATALKIRVVRPIDESKEDW
jgi:hypothetical protein